MNDMANGGGAIMGAMIPRLGIIIETTELS